MGAMGGCWAGNSEAGAGEGWHWEALASFLVELRDARLYPARVSRYHPPNVTGAAFCQPGWGVTAWLEHKRPPPAHGPAPGGQQRGCIRLWQRPVMSRALYSILVRDSWVKVAVLQEK